MKPKGPSFMNNSKNPFVNAHKNSQKASVGKKSLDPMMSNSTSPFRQNLGGRLTVAV